MSYIRFVELCTLGLFLGMLLFLEPGARISRPTWAGRCAPDVPRAAQAMSPGPP